MKRRSILTGAVGLLWAAPLVGAQDRARAPLPAHGVGTGHVVVWVNGVALGERDLRQEMERLFPYYRIHGGQIPAPAEPEIRQKAFDRIVLEELVFEEAQRRKIQAPLTAVAARIQKVRGAYPNRAAFERAIAEQYGTRAEFRRRVWRALMVETLWEKEVEQASRVTEAEVRKYYQQNRHRYMRPESVWLQTISFQFPEHATAVEKKLARALAEQVLGQARAAPTFDAFGALAERYSTDDWRVMNGDHGWVHRGTLDPELGVAFRMQPGETSEIIVSRSGFHILRVNGNRPETLLPYAAVRARARKSLEQERLEKRREEFASELRRRARIEKP